MSVFLSRLLTLAAGTLVLAASQVTVAQTTINMTTAHGNCIAQTSDPNGINYTNGNGTAVQVNGVTLTAGQTGACDPATGGSSSNFAAAAHISGNATSDTTYSPAVNRPFYVVWSASTDATTCTRSGTPNAGASGWSFGSIACTDGSSCSARHSEQVTPMTAGNFNFSVTCTNASGAPAQSTVSVPTPAVPAPTPNPITLSVSATATVGVPFAVTIPTMSSATRCVGTGTLGGNAVSLLGDWSDLTTVTTSRNVTVPTSLGAGTLQITLTCWNSDDSASASGTSAAITVSVASAGACPATITAPDGTTRSLQTLSNITYGVYGSPVRSNVDLSQWNNIWGHNSTTDAITPWPGVGGSAPVLRQFNRGSYFGAHFKTGAYTGINASFLAPSGVGGPNVSMAISKACGDFAAQLPTPGCVKTNIPTSDTTMVLWKFSGNNPTGYCNLQPDTDYYVNMMFTNSTSTVECVSGSTTCVLAPKSFGP